MAYLNSISRTSVYIFYFFNLCVLLPQVTNSLQYSNNTTSVYKKQIDNNSSLFVSLLQPFKSLCIISENMDFLDFFIYSFRFEVQILIFFKAEEMPAYNCECVVMLDIIPQPFRKIANKESNNCAFYSLHYFTTFNISRLEHYFEKSSYSEVVVMSVQDNWLFELSSIFPYPRHFIKSSVKEVIDHRNIQRINNFGGLTITGAFTEYSPFIIVNESISGEVDGTEVLLISELAKQLNFTLKAIFYESWGTVLPNGTWVDGVARAMQEGLAQIAVCGLWQILSLDQVIDYSPSLAMEEIIFLVRRPVQIDFNWKDVLKIFKVIVWFSTLFSFVLVTAVYWFAVVRVIPVYRDDWTFSPLTVFGHFTMSTSHNYCVDMFSLPILTSWSIFSLLLTTSLSTGIVSSLTLPMFSPRINTVQQLVEGGYYWTAQYYINFQSDEMKRSIFNFKNEWHRLFEKKYKYMKEEEVTAALYADEKVTFASQVYNNDFVVLDTEGTEGQEGLKKFRVVREPINRGHVCFGVQKHSPLWEPLSHTTLRFIQAGLPQKWKTDVLHRWPMYNTQSLLVVLVETDVLSFSQPEVLRLAKLRPLLNLLQLLGLCCQVGLPQKWKMDVLHRWPMYNTQSLLVETDVLSFSQPKVLRLAKLRPLLYLLQLLGLCCQAGLPQKWKTDVLHRWPMYNTQSLLVETDVLSFSQPEVLRLAKLRPLFYLLLGGLALASLLFCFELLWQYT